MMVLRPRGVERRAGPAAAKAVERISNTLANLMALFTSLTTKSRTPPDVGRGG
jgi:hypothetical protein